MAPPEIMTPRLRLRPLTEGDVDALVPIYTDPDVTRYYRAPIPDRDAVEQAVWRRLSLPLEPGMGSWVLERDDEVVGLGHLWPSQELPGALPEAGWLLSRAHWGQGLATEAGTAVIDHGLQRLGLPTVWALVHHDNKPSLAVARRLGLLEVGEGRYHGAPHRVFVTPPTGAARRS